MAPYDVRFFKHLLSSDGHPFNCPEWVVHIRHAKSGERALRAAQRRLERQMQVTDWRDRADSCVLESRGCDRSRDAPRAAALTPAIAPAGSLSAASAPPAASRN